MSREADRLIQLLDLKPHPEGGYFKETFRDAGAGRAHSTVNVRVMGLMDLLT